LELRELAALHEPLHLKNNTFPGEVLLELAADAIEEAGASRERLLEFEGIRKRHLPEDRAHRKARHHRAEYPPGGSDGPGGGRTGVARRDDLGGAPITCGSGRSKRW
jgi:hypothetical protein